MCPLTPPFGRQSVNDEHSARLPTAYQGLEALQREFDRYQRCAFPDRPSRFFSLELCGEAGELANLEKKVWKGRSIDSADFIDETADVCIALLNYANSRGIDLATAVEAKMAKIDHRRVQDGEGPLKKDPAKS